MKTIIIAGLFSIAATGAFAADLTIDQLRTCRFDSLSLDRQKEQLDSFGDDVDSERRTLDIKRPFLETRLAMINSFNGGTPEYNYSVREEFRRDAEEYNSLLRQYKRDKKIFNDRSDQYNERVNRFNNSCVGKSASGADIQEVCGDSNDEYCRGFDN